MYLNFTILSSARRTSRAGGFLGTASLAVRWVGIVAESGCHRSRVSRFPCVAGAVWRRNEHELRTGDLCADQRSLWRVSICRLCAIAPGVENGETSSLSRHQSVPSQCGCARAVLPDLSLDAQRSLVRRDLSFLDQSSANLRGAHLRGANLKGALVVDDQLAATRSLDGAIMPNGTTYTCVSEENA